MAEDTRESKPNDPVPAGSAAGTTGATEPPKKLPKGMVLGKDGKP